MHLIQVLTTLCFLCQFASSQGKMSRYLKDNSLYSINFLCCWQFVRRSLWNLNGWKVPNSMTRKVCWIGCWVWTNRLRSNVRPLTGSTTICSCRNKALLVNNLIPHYYLLYFINLIENIQSLSCFLLILFFSKDTRMLRRSPAQYADGVFLPSGADRPNPFTVSRLLMSDDEVSPGSVSKTGKTALLVFFGTFHVKNELKH